MSHESRVYENAWLFAAWRVHVWRFPEEDLGTRGDAEAAEEVLQEFKDKLSRSVSGAKSIEEAVKNVKKWADSEAESEKEEAPTPSNPLVEDISKKGLTFDIFDQAPQQPSGSARKRGPQLPGSPIKRADGLSGLSGSPQGNPRPRQIPRRTVPVPERRKEKEPEQNSDPKALTKKESESLMKAYDAFAKMKGALSPDQIWNSKLRKRQIDAGVKTMNGHVSSLVTILDKSSEASELTSLINKWTDDVVKQFTLLQAIRSSPFSVVDTKLEAGDMELLLSLSMPLLNNLIMHVAGEAARGLDQDWCVEI